MPLPASDVEQNSYLRLLVLGAPKIGKSTCVIATCEGFSYVINCDDPSALKPAQRRTQKFEWDLVHTPDEMEASLKFARDGVKSGKYKNIILDPLSSYGLRLEQLCLRKTVTRGGEEDGRRAYSIYARMLSELVDRLLRIEANIIVTSHYVDTGDGLIDGQLEKKGQGIAPLLAGKARAIIPSMFTDVVYMDLRGGKRNFITAAQGAFGPGCRSLEGAAILPADIGELTKAMRGTKPERKSK